MNNYEPFGKLLETVVDNRGKTCPTADDGIPLIATNCISNDYLYPQFIKVRYVDDATYNHWFRGHPEPGDMIFVLKGTPGRVAWVPDPVNFCIAQDMVSIRANKKKIYPKYLFAALRSKTIQHKIENLHVGTLIPHFKKGDFDDLLIPMLDQKLQRFVGDQYFNMSLKIDLLHRQNETLEALAQTLFRQWFVEQAEDDWEEGVLGDISENIRDSISHDKIPNGTIYIGLEHVRRKNIALDSHGFSDNIKSNKYQFVEDDILFGKLRPYFHKVCFAPFPGVCSTDILVIRPKQINYFNFCLFAYFQKDVVDFANLGSSGTRMPRTNWDFLKKYPIRIPDNQSLLKFNDLSRPLIQKIKKNLFQIRTLENLRDTLLPKLMSGEVQVRIE